PAFAALNAKIATQLEIDAKYHVYLSRQAADVESYRREERLVLRPGLDYSAPPGVSKEGRQKMQLHRPRARGQAGRIDGVTPAALTLLVAHMRRQRAHTATSGTATRGGT